MSAVKQILHENLNMKIVWAEVVPRLLISDQNENRKHFCADNLGKIEMNPKFTSFTWDEATVYSLGNTIRTKDEVSATKQVYSIQFKAMLIVFLILKNNSEPTLTITNKFWNLY